MLQQELMKFNGRAGEIRQGLTLVPANHGFHRGKLHSFMSSNLSPRHAPLGRQHTEEVAPLLASPIAIIVPIASILYAR